MTQETIALFYRRRRPGEESGALLLRALRRYAPGVPFSPTRTAAGRPVPGGGVHASITHSGAFWLCALARQPVGVDLQIHRARRPAALSRRYFHPEEDAFLRRQGGRDFFTVWAAKESYVKWTGRGLGQGLATFSTVEGGAICGRRLGVQLRPLPFAPGYSLCLCARRVGAVAYLSLEEE